MLVVVVWYRDEAGNVIKVNHVFVSDDQKKSCEFVNHCILKVISWFEEQGITHNHIHFWTDGCAGEFKSHNVFMDRALLKQASESKGCTCDCNYFESGHGKGEWDAVGGACKHAASVHCLRMKGQDQPVNSAKELCDWMKENISRPKESTWASRSNSVKLQARHFHYVEVGEVQHHLQSKCKTGIIKGVRNLHQIYFAGEHNLEVKYRELLCFCCACMEQRWEECEDLAIVGSMQTARLKAGNEDTQQVVDGYFNEEQLEYDQGELGYSVTGASEANPCEDDPPTCYCIVNVARDDAYKAQGYDYYVFRATKSAYEVTEAIYDPR